MLMDKVKYPNPIKLKVTPMRVTPTEITSYAGATTAIAGSLTLTDIGVIVGITTALLTFIFNCIYMHRKEQREQRESETRLKIEQAWLERFNTPENPGEVHMPQKPDEAHMPVQL